MGAINFPIEKNLARCIGVAQAVGEQIAQQLLDAAKVPAHGNGRAIAGRHVQLQAALARQLGKALGHAQQRRVCIAVDEIAAQAICIGYRQGVQVIDQAGQLQHFLAQAGHDCSCRLACTVFNRLDLTAQHGQRCAQFMRDLCNPQAARVFQPCQLGGHAVDTLHQLGNLQRAGGLQLARAFARCNVAAGQLQRLQRSAPAQRHDPGRQYGQRQSAQRGHCQAGVLALQKACVQPFGFRLGSQFNARDFNAIDLDGAHCAAYTRWGLAACQTKAFAVGDQYALAEVVRWRGRWLLTWRWWTAKLVATRWWAVKTRRRTGRAAT